MKSTTTYILTLGIFFFLLESCVTDPNFPDEPLIEFNSVSQSVVNEGETISMILDFQDGDGDLGKDPDVEISTCINIIDPVTEEIIDTLDICDIQEMQDRCFSDPAIGVFVLDTRSNCYTAYYSLPDVEPDGEVKDIEGEVELFLPPQLCKFPNNCTGCQDTVVYEIILKDRAQHLSNVVSSDTIIINCN